MERMEEPFSATTVQGRLTQSIRVLAASVQEPVPGISTPLHLHPDRLHLCFCKKGGGLIRSGEQTHRFKPGFVFVLHPGIPHLFRAYKTCPYRAFFVHVETIGAVTRELPLRIPLSGSARSVVERLFRRMHTVHLRGHPRTRPMRLTGLFAELYAKLIERVADERAEGQRAHGEAPFPAPAFQALLDRLQAPPFRFPGLDALAREAGMSRRSFTAFFRDLTGVSPYQLFHRIRMRQAEEWLEAGHMNVSEVARRCGFSTPQNFSRAYTAHFGKPPGRCLRILQNPSRCPPSAVDPRGGVRRSKAGSKQRRRSHSTKMSDKRSVSISNSQGEKRSTLNVERGK